MDQEALMASLINAMTVVMSDHIKQGIGLCQATQSMLSLVFHLNKNSLDGAENAVHHIEGHWAMIVEGISEKAKAEAELQWFMGQGGRVS